MKIFNLLSLFLILKLAVSKQVLEVDEHNYNHFFTGKTDYFIFFYDNEWDKCLEPLSYYEEAVRSYTDNNYNENYLKLNIAIYEDFKDIFEVQNVPSLAFFNSKGKNLIYFEGEMTKDNFFKFIEKGYVEEVTSELSRFEDLETREVDGKIILFIGDKIVNEYEFEALKENYKKAGYSQLYHIRGVKYYKQHELKTQKDHITFVQEWDKGYLLNEELIPLTEKEFFNPYKIANVLYFYGREFIRKLTFQDIQDYEENHRPTLILVEEHSTIKKKKLEDALNKLKLRIQILYTTFDSNEMKELNSKYKFTTQSVPFMFLLDCPGSCRVVTEDIFLKSNTDFSAETIQKFFNEWLENKLAKYTIPQYDPFIEIEYGGIYRIDEKHLNSFLTVYKDKDIIVLNQRPTKKGRIALLRFSRAFRKLKDNKHFIFARVINQVKKPVQDTIFEKYIKTNLLFFPSQEESTGPNDDLLYWRRKSFVLLHQPFFTKEIIDFIVVSSSHSLQVKKLKEEYDRIDIDEVEEYNNLTKEDLLEEGDKFDEEVLQREIVDLLKERAKTMTEEEIKEFVEFVEQQRKTEDGEINLKELPQNIRDHLPTDISHIVDKFRKEEQEVEAHIAKEMQDFENSMDSQGDNNMNSVEDNANANTGIEDDENDSENDDYSLKSDL